MSAMDGEVAAVAPPLRKVLKARRPSAAQGGAAHGRAQAAGEDFAFNCEMIDLSDRELGEAALLPLLESFSRGEFTRVKRLYLVIASACEMMASLSHAWYLVEK